MHHVYANRSNIGDWLCARAMQRLLQPLPVTEHLCDAGFVEPTLEALARIERDELVLIGGGGLFMDYFTPFWRGLRALAGAPRYCIWGAGYCDLKAEPSRPPPDLMRQVVAGSRMCVVRDALTRRHLAGAVTAAPVPCPSLLAVEPAPGGWGILHVDNYTTAGVRAFEAMDAACRDHARRTGRPYRRTNNRIEPGSENELRACLALYAQSDAIVSSALHGCIIGVAMGKPVLAVSGDWKIEAFMQSAGLGDWVLDASTGLDWLAQRIAALATQPDARRFVETARDQNRRVADAVRVLASAKGRQP